MRIITLYIVGILLLCGCSSVKNMPPGARRLDDNKVVVKGNKEVKVKELTSYIRQKPNRKILFGLRFHLGLYNAAPQCDSCWFGNALRTLGEAPVVFDENMVLQSNENIRRYLYTRGYYHSRVQDTVIFRKRQARVIYTVYPDTVIRIRSVSYNLGHDSLARVVLADSANSLLKPGDPLSTEVMDKERDRLQNLLHDQAFYSFNKSQIAYMADTIAMKNEADLVMTWSSSSDVPVHHRYKIRNVTIYSDYDQLLAYSDSSYLESYQRTTLPVEYAGAGNVDIYYHDRLSLRKGVLAGALLLRPGDDYDESEVTQTYDNLVALGIYRTVNIQFNGVTDTAGGYFVDCVIRLTPATLQGVKLNLDASMSTNGLFGISPSVSYFHRNLLRGAEYFNISFSGNFQRKLDNSDQRATELLVAPSLSFPRFLFPWFYYSMQPYKPRTEFSASISHQFNPDYTRDAYSFSFGYNWRTTDKLSYILNVINLNVVHVYDMRNGFYDRLSNPFLRSRYENHFVLGTGFSMIYTDRSPDKHVNSVFMRWNVKTAGNLLSAFNAVLPSDSLGYTIGNTPYAQYAKTDVNLSYYQYLNENNVLAYRIYGGVGSGYGNSISMPLEEAYFSGGAYSLRGWQARTLGPGTALRDTVFSIPNQVGDIKLEANVEFRTKIFGPLEGALFLECGNIWSLNPDDERDGALFRFNRFYKQLALNTGLGLRFNFGFLVFRIDWGVRVHDPLPGKGWIRVADWFRNDNSTFHFGIGYPF